MAEAAVSLRDGIGFDDLVAFCAGMTIICGFLWAILRPVINQVKRGEAFWDDWAGSPAAPGGDHRRRSAGRGERAAASGRVDPHP